MFVDTKRDPPDHQNQCWGFRGSSKIPWSLRSNKIELSETVLDPLEFLVTILKHHVCTFLKNKLRKEHATRTEVVVMFGSPFSGRLLVYLENEFPYWQMFKFALFAFRRINSIKPDVF